MKKIISKLSSKLLSREDLKHIKGGEEYLDGCGSCITFGGTVLPCLAIGGPWGCKCANLNSNNLCG